MSHTITITSTTPRTFVVALIVLAAGCGGGGSSSNGGEQGAQASSGGEGDSMTLAEFASELARQTQSQLCDADDAPLRQCFEVDAQQCGEAFSVAMRECANQLRSELPERVDSSSAESAATAISQCAGQAYRMGLEQNGLFRQTPECQGG